MGNEPLCFFSKWVISTDPPINPSWKCFFSDILLWLSNGAFIRAQTTSSSGQGTYGSMTEAAMSTWGYWICCLQLRIIGACKQSRVVLPLVWCPATIYWHEGRFSSSSGSAAAWVNQRRASASSPMHDAFLRRQNAAKLSELSHTYTHSVSLAWDPPEPGLSCFLLFKLVISASTAGLLQSKEVRAGVVRPQAHF